MNITLDINGKKIQATIRDADTKALTEQPIGRWKPADGNKYWFAEDCGGVEFSDWEAMSLLDVRIKSGDEEFQFAMPIWVAKKLADRIEEVTKPDPNDEE